MIQSLKKFPNPPPVKEDNRRTPLNPARIGSDPESGLLDLVRLRVVQILHDKARVRQQTKKLRAQGETERRLRLLKDWRRSMIFNDHEEAALNLAEALTCDPIDSVPEEVVQVTRLFFNQSQMIRLILAILAVNDWHYLNG